MYSIGLEFSFRELMQVKWVAILPAPVGIALSILPGLETGKLFGWSTAQGVTVGALVAVASTMVLSKFLAERGELRSRQGQVMIGITLVEDLAVAVLTVLLPSLTELSGDKVLAITLAVGKALLILAPVILIAAKLVPGRAWGLHRSGNFRMSCYAWREMRNWWEMMCTTRRWRPRW